MNKYDITEHMKMKFVEIFEEVLDGKIEKLTGIKSLRHARGTLHPELIPEDKKPKGSPDYKPNWGAMAYFDLDKMEWRSFSLPNLQDIEGYIALNEVNLNED